MLYTIQQIPNHPIYIVRILPPLHLHKQIYAIDAELLRLTAQHSGRVVRIDDFTHLHPHQFTLADAAAWFGGPVREDEHWRSNIAHVAICRPGLRRLLPKLRASGTRAFVPVVATMEDALAFARYEINRPREELD